MLDHVGHAMVHLDDEAEKQKIQMKSLIEAKKSDLQAKINIARQLDVDYAKMIKNRRRLEAGNTGVCGQFACNC